MDTSLSLRAGLVARLPSPLLVVLDVVGQSDLYCAHSLRGDRAVISGGGLSRERTFLGELLIVEARYSRNACAGSSRRILSAGTTLATATVTSRNNPAAANVAGS